MPWILGGSVVLLVAAGFISSLLNRFSDLENYDPSPAPRIPLNAPFITTPDLVVNKMIEVGEITDKDLVYDLGCGDGRIVITAALQRGCRGVGFDIDPERVKEARENVKKHGVEHLVTIEEQDVFKVDLSKADVIVMYLLPWMLEKLVPQFDACPDGTRIVSHDFEIELVESDKVVELFPEELDRHLVRLYTTPLKKLPENRKWKLKK